MTISLKRRREIAQEIKQFSEAYRLAAAYAKAGDMDMAEFFLNSVKISETSPGDSNYIKQASKRICELFVEDYERRKQGLPYPEYQKPQLH
jgi:hypothetical protein